MVNAVTFVASLNICMERIGVATDNGSVAFEMKRYEFNAGPRFENIVMATEEVGVAKGSSNEAESSLSKSVLAK